MNRWTCDHRRGPWVCAVPANDAGACISGRHYFVRAGAAR